MIYTFLANGFEEVEALTPVDLLRRCECQVITVGVGSEVIRGAHGIPVLTDIEENSLIITDAVEMIILPGGMPGTLNLEKSQKVQEAITFCMKHHKKIAAICAAPSILGHRNLLNGKNAVCYEGFESQLTGANILTDSVCVDGDIITARSAGVALPFSLKLVEILISKERSDLLAASLMCEQ